MITFEIAKELRRAGLSWQPAMHDFFAIPDRGMDNRVFVISDIQSTVENVLGSPVVAFQGASEWALDYLVTSEVIWLPTEAQLRQTLEEHLLQAGGSQLALFWELSGYRCDVVYRKQSLSFHSSDASDAYAKALLHILQTYSSFS